MEETSQTAPQSSSSPQVGLTATPMLPSQADSHNPPDGVNPPSPESDQQQKKNAIIIGVVALLVVALLIAALVSLLHPGITTPDTVARIRDVFIIFLALESLLIGFVLVILIVQIARLTNLLQNEIKPILTSTNETVNTLRGTAQFISDNLSEPIIVINEFMAAIKQFASLVGLGRKG